MDETARVTRPKTTAAQLSECKKRAHGHCHESVSALSICSETLEKLADCEIVVGATMSVVRSDIFLLISVQ